MVQQLKYESERPRRRIFYGWVVVAISLVIMTATYGVYFSWPVFYVPILAEFGLNRADTAVVFSVASAVYGLASPISGFLFDKFGPRKLFAISGAIIAIGLLGSSQANAIWQLCIFFGVFVGFGTISAGFVPFSALMANWFEKKRATAVGVAQIGTRNSFILTPLIQIAILALGWRNSYMVLAAVAAVITIPLSLFLRARPQDMGLLPDGDTSVKDSERSQPDSSTDEGKGVSADWTLSMALRNYQFYAFFLISTLGGFSITSLIVHFVALVVDFGFTDMFAANLLLIFAISSMTGRVLAFVSDFIGRELAFTLSMAVALLVLPILLVTKDTSAPWMLYIFITFFGLGYGLYSPVYVASVADLFAGKRLGTIIGSANIGFGLGGAFGAWLYGRIFDVTGNYDLAIVATMFCVAMMCIAIWVAAPRKSRRLGGFTAA